MKKTFLFATCAALAVVAWWLSQSPNKLENRTATDQTAAPISTNHVVVATASSQTNATSAMSLETESAALHRLQMSSLTNLAAVFEYRALEETMRVRRFRALSEGGETVTAAIKLALEQGGPLNDGIRELAQHWDDPRAEQTLEQISNRGPRRLPGDLGPSYEGLAYGCLVELRANRQLAEITAGKSSEAERTDAIIAFLEKNPKLTTVYDGSDFRLRETLYGELIKSEDPKAARLIFGSGRILPAYAQKHFQEMLEYARDLSPTQALNNPPLIEALDRSRDKAVIPMFEKWLSYTTETRDREYFTRRIEALRKDQ